MSMGRGSGSVVPVETARVAWAASPKGTPAMAMRDRLQDLFVDDDFVDWFPADGRRGVSPQTNCKVVDHVGLGRGKVARMGRIRVLSAAMRCRVRVIWLWPVSRSIARAMFLIMAMACAPVPV